MVSPHLGRYRGFHKSPPNCAKFYGQSNLSSVLPTSLSTSVHFAFIFSCLDPSDSTRCAIKSRTSEVFFRLGQVLNLDSPCIRFPLPEQTIDHSSSCRARQGLQHRLCKILRQHKVQRKALPLSHNFRRTAGKRESIAAARKKETEDNRLRYRQKILLYPRWTNGGETISYFR